MTEHVTVGSVGAIESGDGTVVDVSGTPTPPVPLDGEYHANGNGCTQMGGSPGEGFGEDVVGRCPLHGAEFEVTPGCCPRSPASEDVQTDSVERAAGEIRVAL
jgi:nitrite reductase/ring-hydroxylating ferredoxin subunit